ncbi:glycosyltransferase [uncultured Neglectibacter sp.]|uniref:MGDG synthase family glycosyltransferase n=1 Tax=uncultured Neglectibacter sp. TaxID=1924108 RepID=UPI0034DE96EE
MKVLILSCNTGQGHNSAGLAVKEELERREIPCEMKDALSFARGHASRTISGAYIGIARKAPSLFGGLYKLGGAISSPKRKSPVYYANTRYAAPLKAYIEEHGFTALVTPHLFPAETLTYLKRREELSVPCYGIATDYTCIPFWEETELDGYFLPHEDLIPEFAGKGIPREKLIPTGLPVSGRYLARMEQREARKKLDLPEDVPVFLVMTGSMGFGDISSFTLDLLLACPVGARIVILTGNNEPLKAKIDTDFAQERRVRTVSFTKEVPLYMDACDVLLSKPGGLTSTEAAVKNVPLVHTRPIPGCETKNARFFSARRLSLFAEDPKDAAKAAVRLAADETLREEMRRRQRETIPGDAAGALASFLQARE